MSGGMDQFLANRITRMGKMQVVADPLTADTILTDKIGAPFEKRLDLLYGSPKKLQEADAAAKLAEEKAAAADEDKDEEKSDDKEVTKSKAVDDKAASEPPRRRRQGSSRHRE